jgi:hypothetical protein
VFAGLFQDIQLNAARGMQQDLVLQLQLCGYISNRVILDSYEINVRFSVDLRKCVCRFCLKLFGEFRYRFLFLPITCEMA